VTRTHGTLVVALFALYPLWWLAGAQAFVWLVVAAALVPVLVRERRSLVVPPGFGLWLLFLGWVLVSAVTLTEAYRLEAAVYRGAFYLAAAVLMVFLCSVPRAALPTRRLALAMVALWASAITLGTLALVLPAETGVVSPVEALLPGGITANPFVDAMVHPRLSVLDTTAGVLRRPTPLAPYTNSWGAMVAMLTPLALYGRGHLRTRVARTALDLGLVVSLLPIVESINRGLWISLGAGVAWVIVRRAARGDVRAVVGSAAALAAVAVAVLATPLGKLIALRIDRPNTATRATLYEASLRAAADSPLLGHGAPVSSGGLYEGNGISVGTHGQFWTVLVSQGWPGAVLFTAFLVAMVVVTRRVTGPALWLQATLVVALVQIAFYDLLPAGLGIYAAALALCLRELVPEPVPTGPPTVVPPPRTVSLEGIPR
jgi:polysaccharide biosynthesis protein PslJ